MSATLDLFAPRMPAPAQTHSPTSVAAAFEIAAHVSDQECMVLAALRGGPLSDMGIYAAIIAVDGRAKESSYRRARIALVARRAVVEVGECIGPSGRRVATWGLAR